MMGLRSIFVASRVLMLGMLVMAQAQAAEQNQPDWEAGARNADDAYWGAYNHVDPKAMNAFLTDDVEFYHDRGGKLIGKKALGAVNDTMSSSDATLRREALPGTVHFFPMRDGEKLYGALVTGEHQFYVLPKGKPEFLAGRAYFTQLMVLQGTSWKISRIFSYEHVDAKAGEK
jgi:hypothetical protein